MPNTPGGLSPKDLDALRGAEESGLTPPPPGASPPEPFDPLAQQMREKIDDFLQRTDPNNTDMTFPDTKVPQGRDPRTRRCL